MPVYNGERYLREAIKSILTQTYKDFEFLIINDGSTDSTREVILSYDDPRIRLVDNERNLGLHRSLNRGLELAEGEYVARQDADDISESERLAKQVAFLEAHADVALLGTWYKQIDSEGNVVKYYERPCDYAGIRFFLLFANAFVHSSVMLRKSVVLGQIGFYNEAFAYAADYELWYRIARHSAVANLDEYLVRYRINAWSMTATYGDRIREGAQISIAAIADLLGLDKTNPALNEVRVTKMKVLLLGGYAHLDPQEVNAIVEEILQIHAVFCRSYGITPDYCTIHRKTLRSQISHRLLEIAHRYFDQNDVAAARQLRGFALRLDWRALLTRIYMWLFFKLLLGFRFVQAMKCPAQKTID